MHELSVCLALIEQVDRIARERKAAAVSRIVVELGPLSGVEPALLRRAYPLAAAGTVAEHAELEIAPSGIIVQCGSCGARSAALPNRLLCSTCGDYRTRIVSGDEMILQRIELASTHGDSALASAAQ